MRNGGHQRAEQDGEDRHPGCEQTRCPESEHLKSLSRVDGLSHEIERVRTPRFDWVFVLLCGAQIFATDASSTAPAFPTRTRHRFRSAQSMNTTCPCAQASGWRRALDGGGRHLRRTATVVVENSCSAFRMRAVGGAAFVERGAINVSNVSMQAVAWRFSIDRSGQDPTTTSSIADIQPHRRASAGHGRGGGNRDRVTAGARLSEPTVGRVPS